MVNREAAEASGYPGKLASFETAYPGTTLARGYSGAPPALVIRIEGPIDSYNYDLFRKLVLEGLGDAETRGGLILDMAGVTYITSTGIGAITMIMFEAERRLLPFHLARVPRNVRNVLEVLGFSAFFDCIESFEEGL
jgi:anti-anti-sigma factor